jgi:hypothetical protein
MLSNLRLTLAFGAVLAASPAMACRVGGDTVFFANKPVPKLAAVVVMKVRMVDFGPRFSSWHQRLRYSEKGQALIGVARAGGHAWFPVYANVTSCTHQFFGGPGSNFDRSGFIVGQFARQPNGDRVFLAAGDWNGRWHY